MGAIAISDWYGGKIIHYSYVVGVYENGSAMVLECGVPKIHKGGCGYRILGSSPNEEVQGYVVF